MIFGLCCKLVMSCCFLSSLLNFIPPFSKMLSEDGGIELEPFQASAFGNCFWCSLSIHLTGNESRQNFLRLASALNAVINAKHFIDKVRYKTVVRKGTTRQLHECVVSELICTCSCFVS